MVEFAHPPTTHTSQGADGHRYQEKHTSCSTNPRCPSCAAWRRRGCLGWRRRWRGWSSHARCCARWGRAGQRGHRRWWRQGWSRCRGRRLALCLQPNTKHARACPRRGRPTSHRCMVSRLHYKQRGVHGHQPTLGQTYITAHGGGGGRGAWADDCVAERRVQECRNAHPTSPLPNRESSISRNHCLHTSASTSE
jgi:hypothetical protein